jgi:hypothetical protein
MHQHACERTNGQAVSSDPERSRVTVASHTSELSTDELNGTYDASMMLPVLVPLQRAMPMPSCPCSRPQPRACSAR